MYMYIYIYTHIYICICICIQIYIHVAVALEGLFCLALSEAPASAGPLETWRDFAEYQKYQLMAPSTRVKVYCLLGFAQKGPKFDG